MALAPLIPTARSLAGRQQGRSRRRRRLHQQQQQQRDRTMLLPLLLLPLVLVLVSVLSSAAPTAAFRSPPVYIRRQQQRGGIGSVLRHHRTRARLVPLPISEDEATAFSLPLGYRVGIVVGGDLSQLTRLLLASFPPDMPMAYPEGSDFVSRRLLRPIYHVTSALSTATANFEMRYGLLSRHGERFAQPGLQGGSLESLSLGVEEEATGRLVAVVELCMRTPDGNLISSIRGPTLRFDASCRPYLCNLAVLPPYRGQGLGRALANHAERVVGVYWKEPVIYLHLDESDPAASQLWASLGYTRVLGAGPSGWYQEMMFEAAAQAGKKLAFHAKWLQRPEEGEPTQGDS